MSIEYGARPLMGATDHKSDLILDLIVGLRIGRRGRGCGRIY
jgi:hypothetical protein